MQIKIISIGKFSNKCNYKDLFYYYFNKIKSNIILIEINTRFSGSDAEIKNKEGKLILEKIHKNSKIILLDENGHNFTSKGFAKKIENFQNQSTQNICFIIGGACGLSDEIKKISKETIAFGSFTYPHLMVRLLLIEQLYRGFLIINNHPYHKE